MQKILKLWTTLREWWQKINNNDINTTCPQCGHNQHTITSQTRDPVSTGFIHRIIFTLRCNRCSHIWEDSK